VTLKLTWSCCGPEVDVSGGSLRTESEPLLAISMRGCPLWPALPQEFERKIIRTYLWTHERYSNATVDSLDVASFTDMHSNARANGAYDRDHYFILRKRLL